MFSVPDESVKEQCGVADDSCGAGLLVLTALQGQPVVHVTFRMEARLERAGRERVRHSHEMIHGVGGGEKDQKMRRKPLWRESPQPALSQSVWNTGADTTGDLAVFTRRTRCHARYHAPTSITSATVAKGQGVCLFKAEI